MNSFNAFSNAPSVAALAAKLDKAGGTITGNGAASTPALTLNGSAFTGGSSTTTKPQFLVEPSGTTSTGWSTGGTLIGANAASGFAGNLLDLKLNGVSGFKVNLNSTGNSKTTLGPRGQYISTQDDYTLELVGYAGTMMKQDAAGVNNMGPNLEIRVGSNAVGFFTATPVAKQTITGSRGSNAALASLLTALATMGLITNSTS